MGRKIGGAWQKPEPERARTEGIILFVVAGVLSTLIFAIPPILSLDRGQKRVETCLQKSAELELGPCATQHQRELSEKSL